MKKLISLALLLSMLVSAFPVSALEYGAEWSGYQGSNEQVYSDVPSDHWAFDAISKVKAAGWFSGYPDGSFKPSGKITREEAMTVLVKFLGLQLKETSNSTYYDVDKTRWSSPYIEAGKNLFPEIERYNGQKPFQPEMPIIREDVMYAMVIAKKYNNEVTFADWSILNMFTDKNSISENLKGYVSTAVKVGLVSGHPNGCIGAQDPLTRAEFASMLYRAQGIGNGTGGGITDVPTVESVVVSLGLVTEMTVGDNVVITAQANMSDGTTQDYSANLAPYNSSNNNVVMMNRNEIKAVNAGTAVIKFNNDPLLADKEHVINVKAPAATPTPTPAPTSTPTPTPTPTPETEEEEADEEENDASLVEIQWSVDSLTLNKGESARIKVIGIYSDGSREDVTSEWSLSSSNPGIASVNANGNVTAVGVGETTINLNNQIMSITVPRPLKVKVEGAENAEIVAMEWSVDKIDISVGESADVILYGVFEDGSKKDISEECGLYCDDESVAVYENGKIKGVAEGDTDIWFESMPKAGIRMPGLLEIHVD